MSLFLRIDSEQRAECFDCGRWLKLYGVQRVFTGNLIQNDTDLRLPPLPNGWSWQPTCRRCGREHQEEVTVPTFDAGNDSTKT